MIKYSSQQFSAFWVRQKTDQRLRTWSVQTCSPPAGDPLGPPQTSVWSLLSSSGLVSGLRGYSFGFSRSPHSLPDCRFGLLTFRFLALRSLLSGRFCWFSGSSFRFQFCLRSSAGDRVFMVVVLLVCSPDWLSASRCLVGLLWFVPPCVFSEAFAGFFLSFLGRFTWLLASRRSSDVSTFSALVFEVSRLSICAWRAL